MIIKDAFGNTAEVHMYDNNTEACNGSNPDFEEALNAEWSFKEM